MPPVYSSDPALSEALVRYDILHADLIAPQPGHNPIAGAGGLLAAPIITAATTNPTVVKAAPGRVFGLSLTNKSAAYRYFKLFNKATAPTVGTDAAQAVYSVPPGASLSVSLADIGMSFTLGIGYCITAGPTNADVVVVAAEDLVGTLHYF